MNIDVIILCIVTSLEHDVKSKFELLKIENFW